MIDTQIKRNQYTFSNIGTICVFEIACIIIRTGKVVILIRWIIGRVSEMRVDPARIARARIASTAQTIRGTIKVFLFVATNHVMVELVSKRAVHNCGALLAFLEQNETKC